MKKSTLRKRAEELPDEEDYGDEEDRRIDFEERISR